MSDTIDEFDRILPVRNSYKYQHIERYNEDELISVLCVELILRYLDYHHMMISKKVYEKSEFETDEEFHKRIYLEDCRESQEFDEMLLKAFGCDSYEIASMFLMHPYNESVNQGTFKFRFQNTAESIVEIDLNLSEEVLIDKVLKSKHEFDKNNIRLNILKRINAVYANKIENAFINFPSRFAEKKRAIIDALFSFDYIKIRNEEIERLNQEATKDYEEKKAIINKLDISKYDQKQQLKDLEDEYNNDMLIQEPNLNTSSSNCYFKEEHFIQSNIAPGTAKKNFYIIQHLITDTIQ